METYLHAVSTGAEYVEFDIRKLRDGTLVCFHDETAGMTYPELCDSVGFEVPTVGAVMAELAGKAAGHLDLKETGYEHEVVRLAAHLLGDGNFVVTSLDDSSIATITRGFPGVLTALALGRSTATGQLGDLFPVRRVRRCGARWIAVNKHLARLGVLRQAARHGIGAMVWTVDEDHLVDRFLTDHRVDVLITNRPVHALGRRASLTPGSSPGGPASTGSPPSRPGT